MVRVLKECLGLQCDAADESCKREFLGISLIIKSVLIILVDKLQSTDEVSVHIRNGKDQDGLCLISCLNVDLVVEVRIVIRIVGNDGLLKP